MNAKNHGSKKGQLLWVRNAHQKGITKFIFIFYAEKKINKKFTSIKIPLQQE